MSVIGSNIIAGASGTVETGYQISRSLRFNSADSANLTRTPGSATNRKTWTWSGWVKRSKLGTGQFIFSAASQSPNNQTNIGFTSGDAFTFDNYNGSTNNATLVSSAVYRDVSAWYHIVVAVDTTQATASNRIKLYVNGVQITAFSTSTYFAQNDDSYVNSTKIHSIGRVADFGTSPSNIMLADVYLIDGQALTPSSFGANDPNTEVWSPVPYSGTYGTNGFWLKFDDNSGVTATTLGKDSSGNGNNFTPNNFSVTAGTGNDSLVDSPTNYGTDTNAGGEVRGNYATWNPLARFAANFAYANGNLDVTDSSTSNVKTVGTMAFPVTGKWYFEVTATTISGLLGFIGVTTEANANNATVTTEGTYRSNGAIFNLSNSAQTAGNTYTSGDVIGIAVNCDSGTVQFYKNGAAQGATPSFSFTAGSVLYPAIATDNGAGTKAFTANFGQRPFAYTAPSGFKALCTQNLPTPAIGASASTLANKNFDVSLWTGTGTTSQNITNSGAFQPDFVWIKSRSNTYWHELYDSIRGVNKPIYSNATNAEGSYTGMTAFLTNGFTVQDNGTTNQGTNAPGATFAGWQWSAGGSSVTNTSGTITSTVRANTAAGISVITYTGTGSNLTVGHGLGVPPKFWIYKRRNAAATNWPVNYTIFGSMRFLFLNSTAAQGDNSASYWGNLPTSSVIYVGGSDADTNVSGGTYVLYAFAEIAGFSRFGSYTGNGSTDGPFVYCGFRPRWILVKRTDTAGTGWAIYDTSRDSYNVEQQYLGPESSAAESAITFADGLSNGFKLRTVTGSFNASGGTYIFAAFAEAPFNYARAR